MQRIRLLGMTVLLTVMVWAVADHSLTETATVRVKLSLIPTGQQMQVTQVGPTDQAFEVRVSGRKTVIAQLKSRGVLPVRLRISSRAPGTYAVQLLDEIRSQQSELSNVIIQSVSPAFVQMLVDRDMTVTMPIQVLPGSWEYELSPMVEPAEVRVTISELEYSQPGSHNLAVPLESDAYIRQAEPGVLCSTTVPVPLTAVAGSRRVSLRQVEPPSVTLRYKLKEQRRTATIPAVPIKFEASQDIFNGYEVEVRDGGAVVTQPVTIKGPPAVVERILAGEIKLTGTISLTAADKANPGAYRYVTPRFALPANVELVGAPEPIEFCLSARQPPTPEP